jgi:hypothetical protein
MGGKVGSGVSPGIEITPGPLRDSCIQRVSISYFLFIKIKIMSCFSQFSDSLRGPRAGEKNQSGPVTTVFITGGALGTRFAALLTLSRPTARTVASSSSPASGGALGCAPLLARSGFATVKAWPPCSGRSSRYPGLATPSFSPATFGLPASNAPLSQGGRVLPLPPPPVVVAVGLNRPSRRACARRRRSTYMPRHSPTAAHTPSPPRMTSTVLPLPCAGPPA